VIVLQLQAIVVRSLPGGESMATHINARLPLRLEQKLTEYCAKRRVKRSEVVLRALDQYLDNESGEANAYSLAADLIPEAGIRQIQADNLRALARKAFPRQRSR
jgi:hypothetical protein